MGAPLAQADESTSTCRHASVTTLHTTTARPFTSCRPQVHADVRHAILIVAAERAREYGTVNTSSGTPWEKVVLTAFAGSSDFFPPLLEPDARQAGG